MGACMYFVGLLGSISLKTSILLPQTGFYKFYIV